MRPLTPKQAIIGSVLFYVLTIVISYFIPDNVALTGGFLTCIFFTFFIPGVKYTVAAGVASVIGLTCFAIMYAWEMTSVTAIVQFIFKNLLIISATILVLYLKRLYISISYDKTHMTSLFENATEGIILTNSKGTIVLVNPSVERMFEYTAGELVDQPIEVLIPQRYRHSHVKLRDEFYKAPQDRVMGSGRDLHGTKKDGTNFPVEVSLSHYSKNNDSFVIAFIVNITQRKLIEESMVQQKKQLEKVTSDIRRLNAQLEAKVEERTLILKEALQKLEESQQELSEAFDKEKQLNEIKSSFVSMASHEFRTPLSTILSSATLVSKYPLGEDNDKRERHLRKIKDSVGHLNGLLEDFLSLGKLEEGKVSVSSFSFPVKEFMEDVLEEMKVIEKAGQQMIFDYTGQENFYTDKRLLKNILINLLSNALKFSPEKGRVWVTVENSGGELSVAIRDEGLGISEEDQEHLFMTFFRGKNVVNIQGTGLGLPIVKRYLDLLRGNISLQSKLEQGTTVKFTLAALNTGDPG